MLQTARFEEMMKKSPMFSGLPEEDFGQIMKTATYTELKSGDVLFRQHDPASDFFLLLTGKMKLSLLSMEGTEKVVDIINAGNTFAEAIMFRGIPGYPVNAEAVLDASVLRFDTGAYTEILRKSPEACFNVMGCLTVRIHWLMTELDRLSLHNATFRLISYLLETIPEDTTEKTELRLSVPKHIIASRLSITPETFSRTIKRLADENLIDVNPGYIMLNDPVELRRLIAV